MGPKGDRIKTSAHRRGRRDLQATGIQGAACAKPRRMHGREGITIMQQSMEKNVEKQMIIRTFEPNLDQLKQTARQLAHMQDVSLNLYGQASEVLIVVTARAFAQAAATELTESVVFDFGEGSYHDRRFLNKVQAAEERYADEGDAAQSVAARAVAASKYGHADFGAAVMGIGSGEAVYIAVAYRGYVYLRRFKDSDTASKSAALMMLDLIRRLMKKQPVNNARMFKAYSDFDWNEPITRKRANPYLAPIIVLAVLLVLLAGACWYFFTHYSLGGGQGSSLPADNSTGASVPAAPDVQAPAPSVPQPAGDGNTSGADSTVPPAADSTPTASDGAQAGGNVVQPFA